MPVAVDRDDAALDVREDVLLAQADAGELRDELFASLAGLLEARADVHRADSATTEKTNSCSAVALLNPLAATASNAYRVSPSAAISSAPPIGSNSAAAAFTRM